MDRIPAGLAYAWLLLYALCAHAQTNLAPESIPPLRPPHGELPPTFWEQHGLAVMIGGLLLLALIGAAGWLLLRPKPPVATPPLEHARQALAPLARQPEDGLVLSRVSQVLRHYLAAAFKLPPGELTTTEFCRLLIAQPDIGPALSVLVTDFLRQCDERKFAPGAPGPPLGAVAQALQLLEQAEARRQALAAPTAPSPAPSA